MIAELEKRLNGCQLTASPSATRNKKGKIRHISDLDDDIINWNSTDRERRLGLALQKVFFKNQIQSTNSFWYRLKMTGLEANCMEATRINRKQKLAQKRLAALNLSYQLDRKVSN